MSMFIRRRKQASPASEVYREPDDWRGIHHEHAWEPIPGTEYWRGDEGARVVRCPMCYETRTETLFKT